MIDTKELRRLVQAATSGEWYVERGNHIYGRNEVTDGEEVWHPVIACTDDDEVNVNFEANAAFIAAANPAAVSELLDRLEAAESDGLEQARLNGMGSEREAALMAKLEAAEKERDELRNEIACVKEVEFPRKAQAVADAWKGKCERLEAERDALRAELAQLHKEADQFGDGIDWIQRALQAEAKIEEMEKQEPYSYIYEYSNPIDGSPVWRDKPGYWNAQFPKSSKPLYLAPGAKGE